MTAPQPGHDAHRAERRRILRRATLLTIGFFFAAVLVALLGSALVAWLLTATGLPFLETWLIVAAIVILIPLIGMAIGSIRRRRDRSEP